MSQPFPPLDPDPPDDPEIFDFVSPTELVSPFQSDNNNQAINDNPRVLSVGRQEQENDQEDGEEEDGGARSISSSSHGEGSSETVDGEGDYGEGITMKYGAVDRPSLVPENSQTDGFVLHAASDDEDHDDDDFRSQYSLDNASLDGYHLSLGPEENYELDGEGQGEVDEGEDEDEDEDQDEDEGDEDDDGILSARNGDIAMNRAFMHSTGSLHGPNAFAPPFYNRPPTPLPPSPSLTSLLRPPFSTTTSRPTTPDTSDAETPNDTEAAVAKSARNATTVPRASPKVPTYEYYGFALYLGSSLAFLIYLLWSCLPSPFLHQLGIYYYPNRWWSLAIPSYLVMTIIYIYIALASYNTGYLTLPMNSIENIVDEAGNIAVIDGRGRRRPGGSEKVRPGSTTSQTMNAPNRRFNWREIWSEGTDAVLDIPVGGVCEVLYGQDRDQQDMTYASVHQPFSELHASSFRSRTRSQW